MTISGVARPTGGAENRLVYIANFSKELPDEEEFCLPREDEAAVKMLFLPGNFRDFDTYQGPGVPTLLFRNRHACDLRLADIFLGTILG